jgi:hypothetical protein
MKKFLFLFTLLLALQVSARVRYPYESLTIEFEDEYGCGAWNAGLHATRNAIATELGDGHVKHYLEHKLNLEGKYRLCVELDHPDTFARLKTTLESISVTQLAVQLHRDRCDNLDVVDDHGGSVR